MQLDQTNLTIRTRSIAEIGDLTLMMTRRYAADIGRFFGRGAWPWIAIDVGIIGGIAAWRRDAVLQDTEMSSAVWTWHYVMWMTILVVIQTPWAGAAATYWMGQRVFNSEVDSHDVRQRVRQCRGALVWVLGVKRLTIATTLAAAVLIATDHVIGGSIIAIGLLIVVAIIRSSRPFLPEILLLEGCPIRPDANRSTKRSIAPEDDGDSTIVGNAASAGDATRPPISASVRSSNLHRPHVAELNGRFMATSIAMLAIATILYFALSAVLGFLIRDGRLLWYLEMGLALPLALWTAAMLSVVARLLGYLDCRIRLEGWDVELAVRAEAMRQFGADPAGA